MRGSSRRWASRPTDFTSNTCRHGDPAGMRSPADFKETRRTEMPNKDLRDWIAGIKAAGELKVITGAEPKEEIGGIVDIYMRKMGNPAVMFDEVPGFPKGHRVIANILTSVPRINIALGLPPESSEMDLTQWWRSYFKNAPSHPTRAVNGGPLLDNVFEGPKVDIQKIPT